MKIKRDITLIILLTLILYPIYSLALKSDFVMPNKKWNLIKDADHSGLQKLLLIKSSSKEKVYLYWMNPGSETKIQSHPQSEDVVIVQGSLFWLNEDKSTQKKLTIGDYVERNGNLKHGPFKAGPDGCLMYVRLYD